MPDSIERASYYMERAMPIHSSRTGVDRRSDWVKKGCPQPFIIVGAVPIPNSGNSNLPSE